MDEITAILQTLSLMARCGYIDEHECNRAKQTVLENAAEYMTDAYTPAVLATRALLRTGIVPRP